MVEHIEACFSLLQPNFNFDNKFIYLLMMLDLLKYVNLIHLSFSSLLFHEWIKDLNKNIFQEKNYIVRQFNLKVINACCFFLNFECFQTCNLNSFNFMKCTF